MWWILKVQETEDTVTTGKSKAASGSAFEATRGEGGRYREWERQRVPHGSGVGVNG